MAVGATVTLPAVRPEVSKPVPLQKTAFVELHVSVEELPELIDEGLAVRVAVGASEAVTVTVADAEADNAPSVQVTE